MQKSNRRTSSAGSKSLLSKQLASIAETLVQASRRRDEELEVRRARERKMSCLSACTSKIGELAEEKECRDEDAVGGKYDGLVDGFVAEAVDHETEEEGEDAVSELQIIDLTAEKVSIGDREREDTGTSRSCEIGEDARRELDDTFERLMRSYETEEVPKEEAEQITDERQRYKQATGSFDEQDEASCRSGSGSGSGQDEVAHQNELDDPTAHNTSAYSPQVGNNAPSDDDPTTLLAELRSLQGSTCEPDVLKHDNEAHADLRRMLSGLVKSSARPQSTIRADQGSDPRQMLAELASLLSLSITNASLPTNSAFEDEDEDEEDEDEDLNILRARLEALRSSKDEFASLTPTPETLDKTTDETFALPQPHPKILPYIIALYLETTGYPWEYIQRWTSHLFTPSPNANPARSLLTTKQDQSTAILRAEARLQNIITSVLSAEQARREKEEETKLQRRIIVTNLAADAENEDVERAFWGCRGDITTISLHPTRSPLKRTKSAYIDFVSREAAVGAEREYMYSDGQVFGLRFGVGLAVPIATPTPVDVEE